MLDRTERRLLLWWAALVGFTLAAWAGYEGAGGLTPTGVGVLVITVAMVKIRIVVLEFMAVCDAPWPLRLPLELWPLLLGATMIALYLAVPG